MVDHTESDADHEARAAGAPVEEKPAGLFCTSCGVSLLDVNVEDACPSCGAPVMRSLTGGVSLSHTGPTSGLAIASLVLGILSIVGCMMYGVPAVVLGPIAIILAKNAKKRVEMGLAGGATLGLASAGSTTGIIGTVLGGLGFALLAIAFLLPLLLRGIP